MTTVTRAMHDRCIAMFGTIKARDPELAAQALARGAGLTPGSPAQLLKQDLLALDAVASSFATGLRPRAAQVKRALALIAGQS
jgi:hypothetical protein